jgi:hypothetical protein
MAPRTTGCPHWHGPARGPIGRGNRGIHSPQAQRFSCHAWPKTCSARQGTVFYRLRPSAAPVVLVVTLRAPGCPVQAIVAALRFDARPVADWWARSGRQGQAGQAALGERPRDRGPGQADASRVKNHGGIVWMALAMLGQTRLWRGGEGSEPRDMPRRRRLSARVRRGAAPRPLLCGTDGVVSYRRAMREPFRAPGPTGPGGRPRRRPGRHVLLAQVVKRYERRRVVETARRMVDGTPAPGETLRRRAQGAGGRHTADSARLNATCRARRAPLARRCRALARHTLTLRHGRDLSGTV